MSNSESTMTSHDNHSHRDDVGAKMGMWLFLFTEVLLFGGMFLVYAAYRFQYSEHFHLAGLELDALMGAINTIVLLTSSLTMALSIAAIQKKDIKFAKIMLAATIFLGILFMVNKYFEWTGKFDKGIFPGSEELLNRENGEILFFGLYYIMTGLHGLHVIIGLLLLVVMYFLILKRKISSSDYVKLENSGLYWHLVDLIWIFLFPLFYLLR